MTGLPVLGLLWQVIPLPLDLRLKARYLGTLPRRYSADADAMETSDERCARRFTIVVFMNPGLIKITRTPQGLISRRSAALNPLDRGVNSRRDCLTRQTFKRKLGSCKCAPQVSETNIRRRYSLQQ